MRARALLQLFCVGGLLTIGCDAGSVTHASDVDPPFGIPESLKEPGTDGPSSGPVVVAIRIDATPVITLSPGETRWLPVTLAYSSEARLGLEVGLLWTATIPDRVEVDGHGVLRAGDRPGHSWVFVEADGQHDSVGVWVQPAESAASSFAISLHFGEGVPSLVAAGPRGGGRALGTRHPGRVA